MQFEDGERPVREIDGGLLFNGAFATPGVNYPSPRNAPVAVYSREAGSSCSAAPTRPPMRR